VKERKVRVRINEVDVKRERGKNGKGGRKKEKIGEVG
jgi:hypothetical protein